MRGLKGKTAIVTGGAAGIGRAIVQRFEEEGTKVVVFDLNGAEKVDITDYEAVKSAVERAGPVDILVNNAGWDMFKPFLKTDPAFWQKIISINLVGAMNVLHCVLPGMAERGHGKVVNVASDAGRVGSSGEAPYSACKGGLIALTKTLARELATKGVRLNVVCPGLTETGMLEQFMQGAGNPDKLREAYRRAVPIGRLGRPEDIAGAVLFLSSDDAEFITGQVLSVSGGLTMHG
jgi:2-hydroxycyclohexanecarboxyl-CoA dehydrogenase